jgi:hypothetical protein
VAQKAKELTDSSDTVSDNGKRPVQFWDIIFYLKQSSSIGLSVPHRKHITSPLRAQEVNAINRFATVVY